MDRDSVSDAVRQYYAGFGEREWRRLENASDGAIEFALTCRALQRHLPQSGRVLDVGGGPGRYAIWLAERGYSVVLADLSPELLQIAQSRIEDAGVGSSVEAIVEADARDLSQWSENSFDAVLAMGPFYHLPDDSERLRAAAEIVRVLKPGSPAFIAMMPRYALLRRTLAIPDERSHVANAGWLRQLLDHGVFENDVPGRFNAGYGVRPEEIKPFFEQFGLDSLALLGLQSLSVGIEAETNALAGDDPATFEIVLELFEEAASDPSILGLCGHLLYIGQKPGDS